MLNRIKFALKYIRYWLFAKHKKGHGIHSPFLFKFITDVLNNKTVSDDLMQVFTLHDKYRNSKEIIEYKEIGAGSNYNSNNRQKIGKMIKRSSVNKKYGKLLFDLVNYFKPKNILELGTSVGISTAYIAQAAKKAKFKSVEGIKEKSIIAQRIASELEQHTEIITGHFDELLDSILNDFEKLDFVFFDGNHHKESTIKYFNSCLNKTHHNTVFVFDDIHWSKEMEEAWEIIKTNEKVKLSIDLFRMGLILFKKELSYEQYVIKF